jgi:hypothetical protein
LSILDSDLLATELTDALTAFDIPQSATVTVREMSGPEWEPVITDVPHACSGWRDSFSAADRANGDVLVTDVKVFIVASSLDITPTTSDKVTIGGATFSIITIQLDPASAAYVCQCRT